MGNWIDAHCHLADARLERDLENILEISRQAGVRRWVQGGVSPADWDRQALLQKRLGKDSFAMSFGLHPWWVARASAEECDRALDRLAERLPEAQGAGELGIDLSHRNGGEGTLAAQARVFREGLRRALRAERPLVLHVVRAHTQVLEILEELGTFPQGGLVHSFSGPKEIAARYIALGLDLSISAAVTRPGYETLKRAVSWLPARHLVIETDSPDQAPSGTSGLNDPSRLIDVARAVGALRKESPELILDRSAARLTELFFGE
jgi:TatD DNase family protein